MKKSISILIAEDKAIVRQGLVAILSFYGHIKVIGQAKNGAEALQLVKELSPDVVLLDLVMPVLDGLDTIPKIVDIAPKTGILVLTSFGTADNIYKTIKLGALGYLLKDEKPEILVEAIHEVSEGRPFIPPHITLQMIREGEGFSSQKNNSSILTKREIETLRWIAQGFSNEKIAKKMSVQEQTISKYVSIILDKLNLENRTQAALYALREGIGELGSDEHKA
ncbi:MAG: response regulator transcription factor [Chloroflexi bacterium]|nr:response regulator transcription factor [Chloroflexota bacterium]